MNHRKNGLHRAIAALSLGMLGTGLQAQVIDDLELRRDGANAVLTIRMVMPVQLRRSVASSTDDLVQIFYDVPPSRSTPRFIEGERRTLSGNGLPRIAVSEDGDPGKLNDRKLVVRADRAVRMRVRPGRDSRSIEVQLEGLGSAVAAAETRGATAPPAAPPPPATPSDAQVDSRAAELVGRAREAMAAGDAGLAIENLNEALNLPPNARTREAQELIGLARAARGDTEGARREFELYLQLYPDGPQADRVRQALTSLGGAAAAPAASVTAEAVAPSRTTQTNGSFSQYFYGGNSKTRTQLKDTPLDGQLPVVVSDETLSGTDQKQVLSSVDVNWRSRDADRDVRFAFRDSFTYELMPGEPSENRLSALYLDWKEVGPGLSLRAGRQSGLGGGVLGRFDGVLAGWAFRPKWKLNVVGGRPTDELLDTRRWFAGLSLDAEALTPSLGSSVYLIQQMIDGEVDRRAAGLELRWFAPNASVFSQLEYDLVLKGVNIVSMQGTYTLEDNTTFNVLLDRRATPMLMLGNALFFADPAQVVLPRTMQELLAQTPLADLRQRVADTTAYATQGLVGFTRPFSERWQLGADLRLTNVGAIAPVAVILPQGIPGTGNLWSVGGQAIGTNLYSTRDTHVFSLTLLRGPAYSGWLVSYNNLSSPTEALQIEPSLRVYGQSGPGEGRTLRWTPGVRATWRGGRAWVVESELNVESSRTTGASLDEQATRYFYYLGYRLEF